MVDIHISSKGTPYVYASELQIVLGVTQPLETWVADISFGFSAGIDFAELSGGEDWFLRLEMAQYAALVQRTEKGKLLRQHLIFVGNQHQAGQLLNKKQMAGLIELVKVLGYFSLQEHLEREHFNFFGKPDAWWQYRATLLGYSKSDLKTAVESVGKRYKSQRQALMVISKDSKYKLVRMATIDLFVSLGKSAAYATNVADITEMFAIEMKVNVYDDTDLTIDFKGEEEKRTISKIKNREPELLSSF